MRRAQLCVGEQAQRPSCSFLAGSDPCVHTVWWARLHSCRFNCRFAGIRRLCPACLGRHPIAASNLNLSVLTKCVVDGSKLGQCGCRTWMCVGWCDRFSPNATSTACRWSYGVAPRPTRAPRQSYGHGVTLPAPRLFRVTGCRRKHDRACTRNINNIQICTWTHTCTDTQMQKHTNTRAR